MTRNSLMKEKMKDSLFSALPIILIVILLCIFLVPVESGIMLSFLLGAFFLIIGMGLFGMGADVSMTQIGTHMGTKLTQSRKLGLILAASFLLGVIVTMAEPDLQVLADNVPAIDKTVLVVSVAVGVGFFLMLSMLRIVIGIPLTIMLRIGYAIVFLLAVFSDADFLSVAFDSGGVTTGPITVPFIMALGVGVASIRSDERAKSDSFGLVALCSIGPVLSVLILGFFYPTDSQEISSILVNSYENTLQLGAEYLKAMPGYMQEVATALLPVIVIFYLFQIFSLKLDKRALKKITVGLVYTYLGLVLFLTGVNVGMSSMGYCLGKTLVEYGFEWFLIPLAMLMGWFIIKAEPAVHVLNKQVNELSAGAISKKTMGLTLSIGIAAAMGLSMIRVLTGLSILWFVIPGYLASLLLSFFVDPTFTAIAFDAGGVASGPLTSTFMLPFAMGACTALGGNVMSDAFGLVAMVAMMPLIVVQVMGALSAVRTKRETVGQLDLDNDEIIELWEI